MAMRKWSIIEEELKRSGVVHPMVLRTLGEFHERLRQQHQQDMQLAEAYSKLADEVIALRGIITGMDGRLEKLGIKEKLLQLEGDPDETGSTYDIMRNEPGKKN